MAERFESATPPTRKYSRLCGYRLNPPYFLPSRTRCFCHRRHSCSKPVPASRHVEIQISTSKTKITDTRLGCPLFLAEKEQYPSCTQFQHYIFPLPYSLPVTSNPSVASRISRPVSYKFNNHLERLVYEMLFKLKYMCANTAHRRTLYDRSNCNTNTFKGI